MEFGKLNTLVILGRPGCTACQSAGRIVDKLVADKTIVRADVSVINVFEGSAENKKKFTDVFSLVPQIFIHGKHYPGGSSNFSQMYESGKLAEVLGRSAM